MQIGQVIARIFDIDSKELKVVLSSFCLVMFLMTSYYILRPVRDSMASDWSDIEVSWLWTFTFLFSAIAIPVYGYIASRVRLIYLIPGVYIFFALSFLLFYFSTHITALKTISDKAFYVWVSVYALFHVSVFWSLMAEVFSKAQAKRLFGFIAAGASLGAIIGPFFTAIFVSALGNHLLLLIASAIIILAVPLIVMIQNPSNMDFHHPQSTALLSGKTLIGGNSIEGLKILFNDRFLIGIALFIFFATLLSSVIYFELKNILSSIDPETRTQIWAGMDLAVNTLSIGIGLFATGRVTKKLGISFSLSLIPALLIVGFLILTMIPTIAVIVSLQIVRRAGQYSITRPAREMLFTVVGPNSRFKSKPIIDVVLYRGGDVISAWTITGLTQGLNFGLTSMAGIGAVIAAIWTGVGLILGKKFIHLEKLQNDD